MSDGNPGSKAALSLPQLQEVLGKAIADERLRRTLLADPAAALRGLGLPDHPDAVAFFRTLGAEGFDKAAAAFEAARSKRDDAALDSGET